MAGRQATYIFEHSVPTFRIIESPNTKPSPLYDDPAPYTAFQIPFQLQPIVSLLPVPCSSLLVPQFEVKHSVLSPLEI